MQSTSHIVKKTFWEFERNYSVPFSRRRVALRIMPRVFHRLQFTLQLSAFVSSRQGCLFAQRMSSLVPMELLTFFATGTEAPISSASSREYRECSFSGVHLVCDFFNVSLLQDSFGHIESRTALFLVGLPSSHEQPWSGRMFMLRNVVGPIQLSERIQVTSMSRKSLMPLSSTFSDLVFGLPHHVKRC